MSYDQRYRPLMGHWNHNTLITQKGELLATFHVGGTNFELQDEGNARATRDIINQTSIATLDTRLEWWQHFVRTDKQKTPLLPSCSSWWAKEFDQARYDRCFQRNIYRNDLFFTILLRPWRGLEGILPKTARATRLFEEEFEDLVSKTLNNLRIFSPVRLGMVEDATYGWVSQIGQAHHLFGNGFYRPIPVASGKGRLSRSIMPHRPVFKERHYELLVNDKIVYNAAYVFANYPGQTHPSMFELFRSANFPLTITNSYQPKSTNKALRELESQQTFLAMGKDSKREQSRLENKQEDLKDAMETWGTHHFLLTVRADSKESLNKSSWQVDDMVSQSRATLARCDEKTVMVAYYAQFPGNRRWAPRTGGTGSVNFASYGALNNVPVGDPKSRWGAPICYLRTRKNTIYPFHFHVLGDPTIRAEDVGSYCTVGMMGSGKTSHNNMSLALAERVGARAVVFDKDCGAAPFIKAVGGEYLVFKNGEPSGVTLLRSDEVTQDHAFTALSSLIMSDGLGPMSSADKEELDHQIRYQLSMPKQYRSIDGIWPFLDTAEGGAGSRLKIWGRGQAKGWAFDGLTDRVNIHSRMLGFDTTDLSENAAVCEPMLMEIFYRLQGIVYQRKPLVVALDECWKHIGANPGAAVDNARMIDVIDNHSRTIRKNEGIIGLITQNGHALLTSPMATTITQNFPTKNFFGDNNLSDKVIKGFNLTQKEAKIIRQELPLTPGSFLVKQSNRSFVAVNDMSLLPEHVAVLSGRRATYDLVLALEQRYGTAPENWVPHFQQMAPAIVADPHLDPKELVFGRQFMVAAE